MSYFQTGIEMGEQSNRLNEIRDVAKTTVYLRHVSKKETTGNIVDKNRHTEHCCSVDPYTSVKLTGF